MDPLAKANQLTLQTVDRALMFLEFVANAAEPPTIRQVSDELELNLTTCYHLFNTLNMRQYIERNPDQTLRIGFQVGVLFDGYRRGFSDYRVINELVHKLAAASSETAFLSTLVNDSVTLVAFAEGNQSVRATGLYVGLNGNEHVRSSGKAVLAFLDDEQRGRIISNSLSVIPPSRRAEEMAALNAELALVAERGWALDDQGYEKGITGVAAPYFNEAGAVVGAIGMWSPSERFLSHRDEIIQTVVSAAQEATESLGRFK